MKKERRQLRCFHINFARVRVSHRSDGISSEFTIFSAILIWLRQCSESSEIFWLKLRAICMLSALDLWSISHQFAMERERDEAESVEKHWREINVVDLSKMFIESWNYIAFSSISSLKLLKFFVFSYFHWLKEHEYELFPKDISSSFPINLCKWLS